MSPVPPTKRNFPFTSKLTPLLFYYRILQVYKRSSLSTVPPVSHTKRNFPLGQTSTPSLLRYAATVCTQTISFTLFPFSSTKTSPFGTASTPHCDPSTLSTIYSCLHPSLASPLVSPAEGHLLEIVRTQSLLEDGPASVSSVKGRRRGKSQATLYKENAYMKAFAAPLDKDKTESEVNGRLIIVEVLVY